LRHTRRA